MTASSMAADRRAKVRWLWVCSAWSKYRVSRARTYAPASMLMSSIAPPSARVIWPHSGQRFVAFSPSSCIYAPSLFLAEAPFPEP